MESSKRITYLDIEVKKAIIQEIDSIWNMFEQGIAKRKREGSLQWQYGYPNRNTILADIEKDYGYVVTYKNEICGYFALIFDIEPAYEAIEGVWLNNNDYGVIHRLVTNQERKVKGLAESILLKIEKLVKKKNRYEIKVDTNFDNHAMLYLFDKLGYQYCGEVYFRGSARRAFQKSLV